MKHIISVFEGGQFVPVEGPGPLDFEWDDFSTALDCAGYEYYYKGGPQDYGAGLAIYHRKQMNEIPHQWRDLHFFIEYWIGDSAIESVYIKTARDMWEFLRYISPVFQMLWLDQIREDADEREESAKREENPLEYRELAQKRKEAAKADAERDRGRREKTVKKWDEHLAKAYLVSR